MSPNQVIDEAQKPLTHRKVYRYRLGHVWFRAVTVGDLMTYLTQFPADMPVLAQWEGTTHSLTSPEVKQFDGEDALIFDVESNVTDDR
jgi:hypothetical protein